jgi:hypothetical protein
MPGYRDVVQAQVNFQLRAVMNEVVHDHSSQNGHVRHGHHWLARKG